ncbi:MAG: ABC transporter ATP-binding protein [Clostridiaceae bacterium]|nr:ABC transporter ATP-binding protein [Eubacteriales bacterium]
MGNAVPVVSFRNFTFQYLAQAEPTLYDISLDIYPGEKILIVGPSGSGKSTLGHCINGLIPFAYKGKSTGSLKVAGLEVKEQDIFKLSKHVGTVLQDTDGQFVGLTAGEDIAFALENDRVPTPEMRERVLRVAKMVDMDRFLSNSPYELSGGQKQRTSLAGVMIDDVELLLFDEPLANLDPATGKTAIEIIDDIHKSTKKTIIIIEHRLEDVLHRYVDRIVVVNDGRIVADMPSDELLCGDVLKENGIREPLYVTALKYAGVKLAPAMRPGHIETLDVSSCANALKTWMREAERMEEPRLGETLLNMEHIDFSYDPGKPVLKDVSFSVRRGEMFSVIGRNGAGKSTLTKLLCGFEKPDGGKIFYEGKNIEEQTIRERAEYIGLVMQNPNQMISETLIAKEVGLGLKLRGVDAETAKERVKKALDICGLSPFIDWPVSALSYGQKKRVTVAAMLALDPKILLLDEPTAGQDYRHYTEIMRFLLDLNKKGVTVALITHDMHLMLEYTPRAVVLSDGELIADAAASDILTDDRVIERANLKETSLYTLARRCGIANAAAFVQCFIDHERWVREREA